MNTRMIVMASFAALAMGVGVPGVAAAHGQDQAGGAGMMRAGQGPGPMGQRGDMDDMMGVLPDGVAAGPRGGGMPGGYGMPGGGRMGYGVLGGGMMGACPVMAGAGLDPGTAMRMRGEMMRAMGDILVKYADKIPASPPKP
ncbi:MAG: hypothetical protein WCY95_02595 [Castellaniella sp.]